jgi:hypothetical protein
LNQPRPATPPIRTCVGCRATAPQAELVRIAVVDGRAVADPRRRLPGRGAYLHARPACVAAAGKGLARSLKRAVGRAELDGLTRAVLAGPVDPGVIPTIRSGKADADAVEIVSPSSARSMSNPRPTSLPSPRSTRPSPTPDGDKGRRA